MISNHPKCIQVNIAGQFCCSMQFLGDTELPEVYCRAVCHWKNYLAWASNIKRPFTGILETSDLTKGIKTFIKVWQKFIKSLPCCKQTLCRQIMSYYQYHFMRKLWKSLILKGTVIASYLPPCTWALDTFQLHLFEEAASEEGIQTGQSYLRGWILVYISIPYQYNNFSLTCV